MKEIELKFWAYSGVLEKIEKISEFKKEKHQKDTYFLVEKNKRYIRIREEDGRVEVALHLMKESHITEESEFSTQKELFDVFSQLGVKKVCVVDKIRKTFARRDITITYDYILGLGEFVELEIMAEDEERVYELKKLAEDLELKDLVNVGYPDLLLEKINKD